jgi:hypothetical protein
MVLLIVVIVPYLDARNVALVPARRSRQSVSPTKKPQPKARELRPPQVSGVACGAQRWTGGVDVGAVLEQE